MVTHTSPEETCTHPDCLNARMEHEEEQVAREEGRDQGLPKMHQFDSGATRSSESGKPDPSGYISPFVLARFSEYMLKHQTQLDGQQRASDNWQKGMDIPRYGRSRVRHEIDAWIIERGGIAYDDHGEEIDLEELLCAMFFNVQGKLHELLRERGYRGMPSLEGQPESESAQQRSMSIEASLLHTLEESLRRMFPKATSHRASGWIMPDGTVIDIYHLKHHQVARILEMSPQQLRALELSGGLVRVRAWAKTSVVRFYVPNPWTRAQSISMSRIREHFNDGEIIGLSDPDDVTYDYPIQEAAIHGQEETQENGRESGEETPYSDPRLPQTIPGAGP